MNNEIKTSYIVPFKKTLYLLLFAACAAPMVGTAAALGGGIFFSMLLGNPWAKQSNAISKKMLQLSVVGLGFGLSLGDVWQVSKHSLLYTVIGIALTIGAGTLMGRLFGTGAKTSALISFGTAICGGSAIAAMSPVIKAEDDETAIALATVFTLNSMALLIFPPIGRLLQMSQHDFGVWAGLAIHDTSSVVGAAAAYGAGALAVGTTVKLARAIWITPCVMVAAWLGKSEQKSKIPLFIVGFIAASTLRALLPQFSEIWGGLAAIARQALVMTLFLIGAGLNRGMFHKVSVRPLLQGVALWLLVSTLTLTAILHGIIG